MAGCPRLVTAGTGSVLDTDPQALRAFNDDETAAWLQRNNKFTLVAIPDLTELSDRPFLDEHFENKRFTFDPDGTLYYFAGNSPTDVFASWSTLRLKSQTVGGTVTQLFTEGVAAPMPHHPNLMWHPYDGMLYLAIPDKGLFRSDPSTGDRDLLDADYDRMEAAAHDGTHGGLWFFQPGSGSGLWDLVRWDLPTDTALVAITDIPYDFPQVVTGGGRAFVYWHDTDHEFRVVEADGTVSTVAACAGIFPTGASVAAGAATRWAGGSSYFTAYAEDFSSIDLWVWPGGGGWRIGRVGWPT